MTDLPENARRYLDAVERLSGAPICLVSVGPERHQTIVRMERPQRPKGNGRAKVKAAAGTAGTARGPKAKGPKVAKGAKGPQ
jgi:hypothetical protein